MNKMRSARDQIEKRDLTANCPTATCSLLKSGNIRSYRLGKTPADSVRKDRHCLDSSSKRVRNYRSVPPPFSSPHPPPSCEPATFVSAPPPPSSPLAPHFLHLHPLLLRPQHGGTFLPYSILSFYFSICFLRRLHLCQVHASIRVCIHVSMYEYYMNATSYVWIQSVCVCVRVCACVAWGYIRACLHTHVNTPVFPHIHAFVDDGVCVYMHNTNTHPPTNTHPHNTPVIKITRVEEGCGSEFSQCINLHLYKFRHTHKNRANTKPQMFNIIIHQDTGKLLRVHTPRTRSHPQHTRASAHFLSRHLLATYYFEPISPYPLRTFPSSMRTFTNSQNPLSAARFNNGEGISPFFYCLMSVPLILVYRTQEYSLFPLSYD